MADFLKVDADPISSTLTASRAGGNPDASALPGYWFLGDPNRLAATLIEVGSPTIVKRRQARKVPLWRDSAGSRDERNADRKSKADGAGLRPSTIGSHPQPSFMPTLITVRSSTAL